MSVRRGMPTRPYAWHATAALDPVVTIRAGPVG